MVELGQLTGIAYISSVNTVFIYSKSFFFYIHNLNDAQLSAHMIILSVCVFFSCLGNLYDTIRLTLTFVP